LNGYVTSCISGLFKVLQLINLKNFIYFSLYGTSKCKSAIIGKIKFIYVMLLKYCNINVIMWPVRQI